jgi:hypothetical protein
MMFVGHVAAAAADPESRSVREFGAKGDAETDDTAAFQAALDDAGKIGGRVFVPPGRYMLRGRLNVPDSVTLFGSFTAPARTQYSTGKLEKEKGSILLTTVGKNEPDAEAFIKLNSDSHLSGLIIFYPEQTTDIVPYPFCVRGIGDNVDITNLLIVNPYQAVDLGANACGRHYINGLYAQALKTGLVIDKCFDVGRVSNVHFWPFWLDDKKVNDWVKANGTAFVIGRTDWEYMTNCFAILYKIGFHFVARADGPGNAVLTQCGSDVGPLAVKVDALQRHAGVSFVNGQFMSTIEVSETNEGPVKFTACGFWGTDETSEHARLRGSGHVTFTGCHFTDWARKNTEAPCIVATNGGLTVNGCEFLDHSPTKKHIELGENVEAAAIVANRFHAQPQIINRSEGEVSITSNVTGKVRKKTK